MFFSTTYDTRASRPHSEFTSSHAPTNPLSRQNVISVYNLRHRSNRSRSTTINERDGLGNRIDGQKRMIYSEFDRLTVAQTNPKTRASTRFNRIFAGRYSG